MRTGPSTSNPKSFHLNGFFGLGAGELVLLSVKFVVAQKFEERAMVGVAARLGEHVHLRALVPILRRVNADLNLELLDRVDGRKGDVGVEVHVHVVDAVERVVIEEDALPAGGDCLLGAFAALAGTRLPRGRREYVHVGRKRDEIQVLSAVQRQFRHNLVFDHCADGRVFGC